MIKQEAAVRSIVEAAQRRSHELEVAQASAWARQRYSDVLERLGR